MTPSLSALEIEELILTPSWFGESTVVYSVTRHSQSLIPTRHLGKIWVAYSQTEGVPVCILGSIPEDWKDGKPIVALCEALLAHVGLPIDTPYDADFHYGPPKICIATQVDRDGLQFRI